MYLVHDRIFWIYFIISLFFIIIGIKLIFESNILNRVIVSIPWIISNIILMILTYYITIDSCPLILDYNKKNLSIFNFQTFLLVVLLIISTIWIGELSNPNENLLLKVTNILMLLGGLIIVCFGIKLKQFDICNILFWIFVTVYLFIWFIFALKLIEI